MPSRRIASLACRPAPARLRAPTSHAAKQCKCGKRVQGVPFAAEGETEADPSGDSPRTQCRAGRTDRPDRGSRGAPR